MGSRSVSARDREAQDAAESQQKLRPHVVLCHAEEFLSGGLR